MEGAWIQFGAIILASVMTIAVGWGGKMILDLKGDMAENAKEQRALMKDHEKENRVFREDIKERVARIEAYHKNGH